jgi:L-amino acid N-acyltransferase YncA
MTDPTAEPAAGFAVRPMTSEDASAFEAFISHVPAGDTRFLKGNPEGPAQAFAGFIRDPNARRLVAVESDQVIGVAGAFPDSGWSSHVAEIRVLVSADRRRRGLGRVLARSALVEAVKLGCTHAYVEVVAEQEALVAMFQDLGFEPQALLADFVRDGAGDFHDLMILTHRADDQWGRSQLFGLTEVVA